MQDLAEKYLICRALSQSAAVQVRVAVRHWRQHFRDLPVAQVKPSALDAFSVQLAQSLSPATVNKTRAHLRAILSWAADSGELGGDRYWIRWKKLREPKRAPVAFLAEEFQQVLAVCRTWPGWICGVPADAWWESLLLSLWYSGGRIGAVLQVTWGDVLLDRGGFFLRAEYQKQKADQFFTVGVDCVDAWQRSLQPVRDLVWPWDMRREALYYAFRRILVVAGVEPGHFAGCLLHRIRKSTASYIKAAGGDATGQLGHSCLSVTQRYFDPRIVGSHDSTSFMPTLSR